MSLKITGPTKNKNAPFTKDYISQFRDFLASNGFEPDPKKGLVTDGSVGRAYINIGNQRKLVGWYQAWLDQTSPFGRIGDYRVSADQPTATWKPENSGRYRMTKEQKAEIEELRRQAEVKSQEKYTQAAQRAQSIWDQCEEVEKHPYLERKQVLSYGLRKDNHDNLVLPLKDGQGTIVGLQYISDEGEKRFLTGSKKSGSFFLLGREIFNASDSLNYAEGYATAASIYADRSQPVVVAFDAYNLIKVAEVMYKYFPNHKHIFVADNDDSNTGENEAKKAAAYIQKSGGYAEVQMPETKGDYNDHATEEALEGEVILQNIDVPVEYDFQRNQSGRFLNTKDNINGVLKVHDVDVRYNVIKKKLEIDIPDMEFIADMFEEASLIEIEDRCINMGIPHTKVRDYLKVLAREYNPVKEWIDSEPWDGTDRLPDFLGSLTTEESAQLKDMLLKKWLVSCVAAAYEKNGVELEGILVLQGAQGLGKTLWFKRLCDYNKGWLLEGATLNPSDKDSVKRAVSHWIVELGEIESTFKKSDIDQLKAFVTSKTDELRLPYDRAFTTYQRRTAFYASVNAREFLTDTSGNRRFWVLAVRDINVNHGVNMQQLWAQVKETMYVPGQKNWFLSPDERELLHDSNEAYRTQSSVEDLILEHVNFGSEYAKPVQMTKLLRDLGIKAPRMPDFKEASRVLHERGIEPRRSNGKKIYDLEYTPVEEDSGGFSSNYGSD
jgi:putative DNA primase/helicase